MQGYIGARSQSTLSLRLGESSTAYSSPSKEISTINGHLAGRKHPQQLAGSGLPGSMVLQRLDPNVVRCTALSAHRRICMTLLGTLCSLLHHSPVLKTDAIETPSLFLSAQPLPEGFQRRLCKLGHEASNQWAEMQSCSRQHSSCPLQKAS